MVLDGGVKGRSGRRGLARRWGRCPAGGCARSFRGGGGGGGRGEVSGCAEIRGYKAREGRAARQSCATGCACMHACTHADGRTCTRAGHRPRALCRAHARMRQPPRRLGGARQRRSAGRRCRRCAAHGSSAARLGALPHPGRSAGDAPGQCVLTAGRRAPVTGDW